MPEKDASTVASKYGIFMDFGPASSHTGNHIIIILDSQGPPAALEPCHYVGQVDPRQADHLPATRPTGSN